MRDAELLEVSRAFIAADKAVRAWGADSNAPDDVGPELIAAWYAAMDKVAALRPLTFAGASAKAHVAALVMDSLELSPVSKEEQMAMATLQEIAALETETAPAP